LIIGMFAPLMSATVLASTISFSLLSRGFSFTATGLIALTLLSFYVAWKKWPRGLYVTGSAILILLLAIIIKWQFGIASLLETSGNNKIASSVLGLIHLDYGLLFLFAGVFLMLLTPRIVKSDIKN